MKTNLWEEIKLEYKNIGLLDDFRSINGSAKNIVIFSDKLLNRSDNEIAKLVDIAILENYVFHFVNEGYTTKNIIK